MSQQNNGGPISLPNNLNLSRYLRVIAAGSALALAGANQRGHGVLQTTVQTTDAQAAVRTYNDSGTLVMVANAAITKYADVYAAASGKIAPTGTIKIGIALETASADGDEIEVLPTHPNRYTPLYTAVADSAAVTTTTTETLFDKQFSIPQNTLKAGDRLKIKYQGIATATNSTDTLAVKLYIGGLTGTALISAAAVDVANSDIFSGECEVVIRTAGASGTFVAEGKYKTTAAAGTATIKDAVTASTAIDTTAAQVVGVSATWSTNNAGNSCLLRIMDVDLVSA